ncbi:unnamed protein product [Brugia timori]|uniref:Uncharacterized protein n=1 Tax=Brugia timori TaxID=42155 RepID=A0A3P7ZXU5_9BILA|nr:unnamed protein product [Brugia timori]
MRNAIYQVVFLTVFDTWWKGIPCISAILPFLSFLPSIVQKFNPDDDAVAGW